MLLPPETDNPRNSEGDFVKLSDGQIFFVYTHFTGTSSSDHATANLSGRFSSDGGLTWTEEDTLVVSNEGNMNVMSPSLLRLEDNSIAMFYLRKNSLADCRPMMRISTDEAQTWSDPIACIPDEEADYYVLNNDRVVQLESGRLIVPVAQHEYNPANGTTNDWAGVIKNYYSDDSGLTWQASTTSLLTTTPEGQRVTTQEPGVIELLDGRLMLFARTNMGSQYVGYSSDGGDTWSDLQPSSMISPRSPATIERIPGTDTLLLAWNDHEDIDPSLEDYRTPYTVAISNDEGLTWEKAKNLYDDPYGWYCYTGMQFEGDYVLLSHSAGDRRTGGLNVSQITRVSLDWIINGEPIVPGPPAAQMASSDFAYKYEMDVSPGDVSQVDLDGNGSPDWTIVGEGIVTPSGTGTLTIDSNGEVYAYLESGISDTNHLWPNEGFNVADGFTLEISLKLGENSGLFGFNAAPADSTEFPYFTIATGGQGWGPDHTLLGDESTTYDNTDDFHVFRLVRNADTDGGKWFVWRDGELLTPGGVNSLYSVERNALYLGDISTASDVSAEVDYLRFTQGAYAPAIPGDANGDGKVDGSDVTILVGQLASRRRKSQTRKRSPGRWATSMAMAKIDGSDVTILAGNWQYGVETAATSVPEPSVLMLLGMAALFLVFRKFTNRFLF